MAQADCVCATVIVVCMIYFSVRGFMRQISSLTAWLLAYQIIQLDYHRLIVRFISNDEIFPTLLLSYGIPTVLGVLCLWCGALLGNYLKQLGRNHGFGETDRLLGAMLGAWFGAVGYLVMLLLRWGPMLDLQNSGLLDQSKLLRALVNRPVISEAAIRVEMFLNQLPDRFHQVNREFLSQSIQAAPAENPITSEDAQSCEAQAERPIEPLE